ncbi:MAG: helix-turn-helix transcriptional regulator [Spirochaetales bacterium]|jgi:AraC-like DNA-binding protein|nr:helix-turn-helix transcriptional regulator [Spirochaetales bacterium]
MCPSRESHRTTDPDWKLQSILRAIEYVENHIHDAIRVGDMADAAGYSVFHFCRCFNELTRHSPHDYQMKRKLSLALKELKSEKPSITRIAMDFGFETPEGFSRAFRKMFGILPSAVRTGNTPDSRLSLQPLTETYLHDLNSCIGIPARTEYNRVDFQGTTDHHQSAAQSLARSQYIEGTAVVDYQPGWEKKGLRLFMETQTRHPLIALIEAGSYTTFPLCCPISMIDSFLYYLFTVFCRRLGGPLNLPSRVVFDVRNGTINEARVCVAIE